MLSIQKLNPNNSFVDLTKTSSPGLSIFGMPYQYSLMKIGLESFCLVNFYFKGNRKSANNSSPHESAARLPHQKWGNLGARETIDSKEAAKRYNGVEVTYFERKDRG